MEPKEETPVVNKPSEDRWSRFIEHKEDRRSFNTFSKESNPNPRGGETRSRYGNSNRGGGYNNGGGRSYNGGNNNGGSNNNRGEGSRFNMNEGGRNFGGQKSGGSGGYYRKNREYETDWGFRADGRKNYIDNYTMDEIERLFGEHTQRPSDGIDFSKYEDLPVEVKLPAGVELEPCTTFDDLHPALLANIKKLGYKAPTPIQKYAISVGVHHLDLMGCAQTGSGKTCAYLTPVIEKMINQGPPDEQPSNPDRYQNPMYPVYLILAPTRELALQIQDEAKKLTSKTGIRCCAVYGGSEIRRQIIDLQRGVDILVACPGRLIDLIDRGIINLGCVKFLTFDEADRMLDMGFEPQIRQIVEKEDVPTERETMMFSATFPREIQALASSFLKAHAFLSIGRIGSTTDCITQRVFFVDNPDKPNFLHEILQDSTGQTIIFAETKRGVDELDNFLYNAQYAVTSIHGDRAQAQRMEALQEFKSGKAPILVATDVAARGLDIPNVTQVINYDMPTNIDDYVHRIGRTGRTGKSGLAMSFYNDNNKPILKDLYECLQENNQELPDWLESAYKQSVGYSYRNNRGRYGGYGNRGGSRGGNRRYGNNSGGYERRPFNNNRGGGSGNRGGRGGEGGYRRDF
mmetsp:Transcript_60657/g.69291  ORF Transcript_60657/g.69291 Transcript_60657/m.69291 type:complete len:630 (-) Transcript_60657:1583-3472(-)|eukprot:CAMPEP_0115012302 /NCGR_PEP_ID=MMETSP0216-20121206/24639_1 /TAXON_ID=223996 /ORGANISM="Protocruzia adherens, Strain Boccale" /LENGTH=629 /DNA_ID=CAMNT_0002381299 /DNA_START=102 /DNA_END=1991 /DNA_ORIENTATION=-